ncbi:MAG: 2'-5' RNA ligase family protein [Salegentibacter sp.]
MSQQNLLYFIALIAPAGIRKEIENFKKEIKQKYGAKHALKLPAHLTLQIPFRMEEKKERQLIKALDKFAASQKAFEVKLNGFGKFSRNVIFVKIEDHKPVVHLYENLQEILQEQLELKDHEKTAKIHPHLTIASRDLSRQEFPQAWNDFRDREYTASFSADYISLLKHNGKTWELYRKFSFKNSS